jgi:hypothetical protein
MTAFRKKIAALAGAAAAASLLALASGAPAGADELPGVHFYTGPDRTGTDIVADLGNPGVCHELPQSAASYLAIADKNVEVYFNPGCRPGAPGTSSDLSYLTGTFNSGNFPYPAVSYRVRAE